MSDRGVSETLGFVLVFALITGTVGIVYATGLSGLQDAQHAEKVQNVERAFDVLADNVGDLHRRGAPSRATEVRLAGGSLGAGEPVTVRIRAENSSSPLDNATYVVELDPIVYEDERGTTIVYSSGALVRSESGGAVMLSEPGWIVGPNRSVIPLINTIEGESGIGGDGAVLIVTRRQSRTLNDPFEVEGSSTAVVNVTVESSRVAAWKRFFEEAGFDPVDDDVDHGNVTYQFETETLYVPTTGVSVSYSQ